MSRERENTERGGPVRPGQIYLVGDGHPPELFIPHGSPVAPLPDPQYLVLRTIERRDGLGFHWPGEILSFEQVDPASAIALMALDFITPYIPEE